MQPLKAWIWIFISLFAIFEGYTQPVITAFSKDDGLTSQTITVTLADSRGVVWAGGTYGLNAYAGNQWYPLRSIEQQKSVMPQVIGEVYLIHEDRKQNIWVGAEEGLFLYNREYWTYYEAEEDEQYRISDFYEDRKGNLWVTYEFYQDLERDLGFSLISGKLQCLIDNRWYTFDTEVAGTVALKSYSPQEYFTDILEDRNGYLWFSTLEGVYVFNGVTWDSYKEDVLEAKEIYDLIEDVNGDIWAATENGVLVYKSAKWLHYKKRDGLADDVIYKLTEDDMHRVWAFPKGGIRSSGISVYKNGEWYTYNHRDYHVKGKIEDIYPFGDTVVAFSGNGIASFFENKWHPYRMNSGLTDRSYTQALYDRGDKLWIGGDHGLFRFRDGKWSEVIEREDKWTVSILFADRSGKLWIGTEDRGVFLYEAGNIKHYDETSGLSEGEVREIFEDLNGNTWVITKKGITKFDWSLAKH